MCVFEGIFFVKKIDSQVCVCYNIQRCKENARHFNSDLCRTAVEAGDANGGGKNRRCTKWQ